MWDDDFLARRGCEDSSKDVYNAGVQVCFDDGRKYFCGVDQRIERRADEQGSLFRHLMTYRLVCLRQVWQETGEHQHDDPRQLEELVNVFRELSVVWLFLPPGSWMCNTQGACDLDDDPLDIEGLGEHKPV